MPGEQGTCLPLRSWADMTTEDFRAADTARWIAVLPIAAIEQHGPHLPLATDAAIGAGNLAAGLAKVPAHLPVTVLPALAYGKSNEHVSFPGTLSLSAATMIRLIIEIGAAVNRIGVRKLVIANAHGGNVSVMDIAARELRVEFSMLAVTMSWDRLGQPEGLFEADELRFGIHGGDLETSLMLHHRPELVRMEKARDFTPASAAMARDYAVLRATSPVGFAWMAEDLNPAGAIGDAARASAAKGAASAAHAAERFVALLEDVDRFPLERLGRKAEEPQ